MNMKNKIYEYKDNMDRKDLTQSRHDAWVPVLDQTLIKPVQLRI